jgi:hypothetical protein
MKGFLIIVVVLALSLPLSLWAQTIEIGASGESQIVRVRTALNHLTVIQLAEPVLSVAAGSDVFFSSGRNRGARITSSNRQAPSQAWTLRLTPRRLTHHQHSSPWLR